MATISNINGVSAASIVTVDGIAKASVSNVVGQTFPASTVTFVSSDSFTDTSDNFDFSFTVSSNSNRALIVDCFTVTDSMFSVMYNGVAMTQIGKKSVASGTITSYYLSAPSTGSNAVSGSLTGSDTFSILVREYYNVNQATPTGGYTSATITTTTSSSLSPTAGAVGYRVADAIFTGLAETVSEAGQTQRGTNGSASKTSDSANNSNTVGWTFASSSGAHAAYRINPA